MSALMSFKWAQRINCKVKCVARCVSQRMARSAAGNWVQQGNTMRQTSHCCCCVVAYFRENCVTIILAYKNHLRRACNNKCKMHKLAYIKRELLCEMRTADERTDRLLLPALPSINSHNLYVLLRGSARLCTNVICNCCVVDGRGSVGIINTLD